MWSCVWDWLQENKGWFAAIALAIATAIVTGVRAMLIKMVWPIKLSAHSSIKAIWITNLSYASNPHIIFLAKLKVHPRVNNTINEFYLLIERYGKKYKVSSFAGFGEVTPIPIDTGTKLVKDEDVGPFQGRFETSEDKLVSVPFEGQLAVIEWLKSAKIYAVVTTSYRTHWRIRTPLKLEVDNATS